VCDSWHAFEVVRAIVALLFNIKGIVRRVRMLFPGVFNPVSGILVLAFIPQPAESQTVPFSSSNLPIAVIRTNGAVITDEPKVMIDLGIIDNGPGARNHLTDAYNNYNGNAGIEFRGSSSQAFPKKQYGVELWDGSGEDITQSILGLPEEGDWIFFAPYNDKSLMRDALAYRMGRSMGRYASRSRYFELVIDDDYKGVYVLFEKVKRDKNRVPIDDLDPDETDGDDLTGGYILKLDKPTDDPYSIGFESKYAPPRRMGTQPIFFHYEFPDPDDISDPQKEYIRNFMNNFEDVMAGDQFADPVNGIESYIDMGSFVDFFIINEATKNPDGFRISTFMYKEKDSDGGKLHMGPIWDFNLGFGNINFCTNGTPEGFVKDFNEVCGDHFWLVPFWWDRLWNEPAFRMKVAARWQGLRQTHFSTESMHNYIDSVYSALNSEAAGRNFQRWPVLGVETYGNYFIGETYEEEVNWLKTWVNDRFAWLDTALEYEITATTPDSETKLVAYPNPTTDRLNFKYAVSAGGITTFQLFDAIGRVVGMHEETNEAGAHESQVDVAQLPAGPYYFRVQHNNAIVSSGPFIKK
jgi:hypothetical protein